MNLNMYNWMIDTDFFWSMLKAIGAFLLGLSIMIVYVYLKVRQGDSDDDTDEVCDLPLENVMKMESGKSVRKEP